MGVRSFGVIRYCVRWAVAFFAAVLCWSVPAPAQEPADAARPVLRSGCEYDYPPFCIVHEDGSVDGFSVELLRAAAGAMGRDVSFETGTWAEVRGLLERGEIDALPLVGRTPEREALFDFTIPYLTLHGALVVRADTRGINGLEDLSGRRVGVMKGDNAEEFLRREERDFEIVTTPTFEDALRDLAGGGYDAVLIPRLVAIRLIEQAGVRGVRIVDRPVKEFSQEFCFAVHEGDRDALAMLNEGLALVMADGTYRHLHSKWFAALELPSNRKIVIGGDHNYPPFEFLDEQGRPAGFNVELTRAVARAVGMDVEIRLGPWSEIRRALEDGEIDAIQGMFYSPQRDRLYDFSQPYTVIHYVAVRRRGEGDPPADAAALSGLDIVVQRGDIMHDWAVQHGLEDRVTALDSQEDALRELAAGRHDVALVARLTALHWIERRGWSNLDVGERSLLAPGYCFAVPPGNGPLLAQFSEGLRILEQNGEYRRIHGKWLGVHDDARLDLFTALRYSAMVLVPLLLVALAAVAWNWTLRKRVAERTAALRRSEEYLRSMIACSPVALYSIDPQGRVLTWNESAERVFGWTAEEAVGRILPIVPDGKTAEFAALREGVLGGEAFMDMVVERQRKGGERFIGSLSAGPIRSADGEVTAITAFMIDITDRRRLEERLRQGQKLEAIGRLAGGVAHDFNNILTGIQGFANLALDALPPDHQVRSDVEEINTLSKRAADLTRQLLAFGRRQTLEPAVININTLVADTTKMLGRLIGENIELVFEPAAGLGNCKVDPVQIQQVLMNLAVNARDAMPDGGKLTVETGNVVLDRDYAAGHEGVTVGEYVMLAVSDTGVGMDAETRERIFEPFFTTKAQGQGTGLGLATVYGIVKQHGGNIWVYSEPGSGTTFKVYLPRVTADVDVGARSSYDLPTPGGTETILVVEDEDSVRHVVERYLGQRGYRVITAADAREATEKLRADGDGVALLLTDVVLPDRSGRELYEEASQRYPHLRVIYMSGYTANSVVHHGVLEEGIPFLQKPFTADALCSKVREVLEA